MDEERLLKNTTENSNGKAVSGVHSAKIQNLGDLRKISKNTMISINKLLNFGADIVRLVIFSTGMYSDSYMEIKRKAGQFTDEEMEFHIMRVAMEIMGKILKEPEDKANSTYKNLLQLVEKLRASGKDISLQTCILEAINRALQDPDFETDLLNQ